MKTIGNILWLFLGGGLIALAWYIVGFLCCCTILAIPVGIQCFKFGTFTIWPFGRQIKYSGKMTSFLWNIIWIFVFGWELATLSLSIGLVWCVTIVGIPFGLQCFKFAQLALMPFGATIEVLT